VTGTLPLWSGRDPVILNISFVGCARCRCRQLLGSITWGMKEQTGCASLVYLSRFPPTMSFSDFYASDLSDITSSEDDQEFIPNAVKRSSAKKPNREQQPYTIPNPLRPPRSTSYSVRALYGPSSSPLFLLFAHSSIRTNRRWID
jgi:hypothetical protein